jgi:alginate O-acetyltransferase complex protein AlgI
MWYLQAKTFLIIAVFSLAAALLRKVLPGKAFNAVLPVIEIAVIATISVYLACIYAVYIIMGLAFSAILHKKRSKYLFVLCAVASAMPFFIGRLEAFGAAAPSWFVSIGFAFAMLKQIDIYYYVYYAGEPVRPLAYINYMLFLPVFTAGPIFRYRDFVKTYDQPIGLSIGELTADVKRIIRGMFKKVVLAELTLYTMNILLTFESRWYLSFAVVVLSYLLLYFDLSGYSDIAIAFGRMAGCDVPENFKKPMLAPTFTQFWRCWHATLSDWIREHIYVVVAKKRLGKTASSVIALITMIIMSLWHGFHFAYLLAGIYNGLLLMTENLLSLTTVNIRKTKKSVFYLRCFAVNFLFAVNTLVFTLPADKITDVLRGFLK